MGAGLQSLAGAPRLLAGIGRDRLIPQLAFLAQTGKEPRYALIVCALGSLGCIMIGRYHTRTFTHTMRVHNHNQQPQPQTGRCRTVHHHVVSHLLRHHQRRMLLRSLRALSHLPPKLEVLRLAPVATRDPGREGGEYSYAT